MKKLMSWLGGVATVAGLYAASAYWIGQESGKKYQEFLSKASSDYNLVIRNERFSSGLLESQAQSVVDLAELDFIKRMSAEKQQKFLESSERYINFSHRISHGPVAVTNNSIVPALAVVKTTVDLKPEQAAVLKTLFGNEIPLEINTIIGFDGASQSHLSIAEINQDKNGTQTKWSGLLADLDINRSGDKADYMFASPSFSLRDGKGKLNIENISGSGSVNTNDGFVWGGHSIFEVESVNLNFVDKNNNQVKLDMNNLVMHTKQDILNDLVNISNQLTLEKFSALEFSMQSAELDFELNNLDYNTFQELQQSQKMLTSNQNFSEEQRQAQMAMNLFSIVPKLLGRSPELNIKKLSFKTDNGAADASLRVKYHADNNMPVNFANPQTMLAQIKAELRVDVTETLVVKLAIANTRRELAQQLAAQGIRQTPEEIETQSKAMVNQQIDMLVQQQVLIRDDGTLKTIIKFSDNNFTINENPANELIQMLTAGPEI